MMTMKSVISFFAPYEWLNRDGVFLAGNPHEIVNVAGMKGLLHDKCIPVSSR